MVTRNDEDQVFDSVAELFSILSTDRKSVV